MEFNDFILHNMIPVVIFHIFI